MTKRRKEEAPEPARDSPNISSYMTADTRNSSRDSGTEPRYRDSGADAQNGQAQCSRQHSRYDSGIHSGVGESLGDMEESDSYLNLLAETPLEELDEVFEEADDQEVIIIDEAPESNLTSTPIRHPTRDPNRLAPPHNFNRSHINGTLTPLSFERLRCLSEGSNEEFQRHFCNGVLSHKDIQADVIAMRLNVIADQLNTSYYRSSSSSFSEDENSVLNDIAARIRALGIMMDMHYFSQPSFIQTHRRLLAGCVVVALATSTIMWFNKS